MALALDLFGLPDQLEALEEVLRLPADDLARADGLARLAWYLRQRDTRRAVQLADEADRLIERAMEPAPQNREEEFSRQDRVSALRARLGLTRAETRILFAELDAGEELLSRAMTTFRGLADPVGEGDARLVEAWLAYDRGQSGRRAEVLAAAVQCYAKAGDDTRLRIAEAMLAREAAYRDAEGADALWGPRMDSSDALGHPGLGALTAFYRGAIAFARHAYVDAVRHWQHGINQAILSGQERLAVMLTLGSGSAFGNINDFAEALSWMEQGRDMAQPKGWPALTGYALIQVSRPTRRLGQAERALALVREGLAWLAPFKQSRTYCTALQYLADAYLDVGEPARALETYTECEYLGRRLGMGDLLTEGLRGQAQSRGLLDNPEGALAAADEAIATAKSRGDKNRLAETYRVLAELHRRYPLAPPDDMVAPNAVIHYLNRALSLTESLEDVIPPAELMKELAEAYAQIGDYAAAYQFERRAGEARDLSRAKQATDRLLAMEVRFQTARARDESSHLRRLAESETGRAEAAQRAIQTLEALGRIGQEITANLDADSVFRALYAAAHELLEADGLGIYLLDRQQRELSLAFGLEQGVPVPAHTIQVDEPDTPAARVARRKTEVLVELVPGDVRAAYADTLPMLTAMFLPMVIGAGDGDGRLLGVITVQSGRQNAYGERERLILRTLAAYSAIALANAEAFRAVREAQNETARALADLTAAQATLIQQEKLASLGRTVAAVTHEINTPIGIALTTAGHLRGEAKRLADAVRGGSAKRGDLDDFAATVEEATRLMEANLARATDLVRSFKQVSSDQVRDEPRRIDLRAWLKELTVSLQPLLRRRGVTLTLPAAGTALWMTTRPGPLGQVVTNIITNAVEHAFDGVERPRIVVSARTDGPGYLRLSLADTGQGMSEEVKAKAFEPFFTTRADKGGTGLGMHIVQSLTTGPLGGAVELTSKVGEGTTVTLKLPRELPQAE